MARRAAGELEQEILAVLARADAPLTPAQVRASLPDGLAYTTVTTTLSRLTAKGAVVREEATRGYLYRWADPSALTARQMRQLLEANDDHRAALVQFVEGLEPADERLLASLLRHRPTKRRRGAR
jgi:predicted transcriptional regulator